MLEILKLSTVKRKIDIQCTEVKEPMPPARHKAGSDAARRHRQELAKKIVAHIKDAKLKVQAAIQASRCASPAEAR